MKQQPLARPKPSHLRRYWPLAPGQVFLNHGSFGACPKPILELQTQLRLEMEAAPVQFLWRHYDDRLQAARTEVARFVGARPRDLVFVTNATTGVNAVARSLKLRRGDELLTINHDYNACHNVLVETARQAGARVITVQVPFPLRGPGEITEAVLRGATSRTRLAMIDHVTSPTALVFPIAQLVRELSARGVDVLVDGAHAPGMVPLRVARLGAAYYTGNLHKWACAPKGAAFLWVREDKQKEMQPPVISHGHNTPRPGFNSFQDRFDWAGTADPTAWFCAAEAIRWLDRLYPGGWPAIRAANRQLAVAARRLLCERLELDAPCPESMLGAMATLPLPEPFQGRPKSGKIEAEQLRLYDQYGVELPLLRFGSPERRYFRISAHLHNSLADYSYTAEAVRSLLVSPRHSHGGDDPEQSGGPRRQRFSGGVEVALRWLEGSLRGAWGGLWVA
jgi:isopenicillin-N epimerase